MPNEIWYLAFVPLIFYAAVMIVLAPRWDRRGPSEGVFLLAMLPESAPLTVPPHPPHTQE